MRSASRKAGLEEADAAVIFDAVDRERRGGRPSCAEDRRRKVALEGEVVDRHHGSRARPPRRSADRRARAPPASRGRGRLRPERRRSRRGRCPPPTRASAAKRCAVVGPVVAVGAEIGIAGAVEEMRRVEHEQVEPGRLAGERRAPARRRDRRTRAPASASASLAITAGIARERACASRRLRAASARGQRAGHVGEPAGLDQRKDLRGDGQNLQRRSSCAELVDHRLGDQADAALGAAEALGVELGILADHQPFGNAHAAVDDHFA